MQVAPLGYAIIIAAGPDEYFVAGDNRAVPLPAHMAGLTRRSEISGGLLW